MLKILSAPNNILNTPAVPVKHIDDKVKNLVKEMEETLIAQVDPQGVGLAANQVGSNLALFIIKPKKTAKTEVFINPRILKSTPHLPAETSAKEGNLKSTTSKNKDKTPLEGCLSIPKIWGPVTRDQKVLLEYMDLEGKKKERWLEDFEAIIIQHEVDHLSGILFTQRALEQGTQLYEEIDGELKKLEY